MEDNNLVSMVSQLYHTVTGKKPEAETNERLRSGVEAALKIKEVDANLFHALVAIGLVEAKHRLGLTEEGCKYADRLVQYYVGKSSYIQTPEK